MEDSMESDFEQAINWGINWYIKNNVAMITEDGKPFEVLTKEELAKGLPWHNSFYDFDEQFLEEQLQVLAVLKDLRAKGDASSRLAADLIAVGMKCPYYKDVDIRDVVGAAYSDQPYNYNSLSSDRFRALEVLLETRAGKETSKIEKHSFSTYESGTGKVKGVTRYDENGKIESLTTYEYNENGGVVSEITYDRNRKMQSKTVSDYVRVGDSEVKTKEVTYNAEGKRTQEISYFETGAPAQQLTFDDNGNLMSEISYSQDGHHKSEIEYRPDGSPRRKWTNTEDGWRETYYDDNGQVTHRTVYNGNQKTTSYGSDGKLKEEVTLDKSRNAVKKTIYNPEEPKSAKEDESIDGNTDKSTPIESVPKPSKLQKTLDSAQAHVSTIVTGHKTEQQEGLLQTKNSR